MTVFPQLKEGTLCGHSEGMGRGGWGSTHCHAGLNLEHLIGIDYAAMKFLWRKMLVVWWGVA